MSATTDAVAIKACCADLYAQDWVRFLLGDSFHPGGLALTRQLGQALGLGPADHVLDVASGPGTSACALAGAFGCRVTGVELSAAQVEHANVAATAQELSHLVRFVAGDAEQLPFEDGAFDAVVCECAFCTFPDKPAAAAEFARVLRPGGRLGLSDMALDPAKLPPSLQSVLGAIACIADARPVAEYVALLTMAGFDRLHVEDYAPALLDLVKQIEFRLLAAKAAVALGKLPLGNVDLSRGKALLADVRAQVAAGNATYVAIAAHVPKGS